jgi:uncharacterized membrane protein
LKSNFILPINLYIFYIIARKHAVALISSLSLAVIPLAWLGSFLFPISSNSFMFSIQAILIAAIVVILFGAYFITLKWTTNQSDHYKIVISLILATALNYTAVGFEKPVKKPSLIDEFIAWVKPTKGVSK